MQPERLHQDPFLTILWDEPARTIALAWREATSGMTDEEFKAELMIFATHVEHKRAPAILVDVSEFRHRPAPDVQQWRVKNISSRYNAAGVKRFAFLFPNGSQIPPGMNQSSPGEDFLTQAFTSRSQALAWLGG